MTKSKALKKKGSARGFTMMEVAIVSMISVFAFGVIYMLWARTQEYFLQGNFKYMVQHEGQKLMENLRQDLLQSCKYVSNETSLNVPVVNQVGDSWSFCRFNGELIKSGKDSGKPLPEKVTYTLNKAEGKVYREVNRASISVLSQNEKKLVAQKVLDLQINQYTLNGLKYFQIKMRIGVNSSETHIRNEELTLITTVESRFDNNFVNQKGWINNPQTMMYQW